MIMSVEPDNCTASLDAKDYRFLYENGKLVETTFGACAVVLLCIYCEAGSY